MNIELDINKYDEVYYDKGIVIQTNHSKITFDCSISDAEILAIELLESIRLNKE